jgi:glycosyltransferase involved in cell wall biosynthesis
VPGVVTVAIPTLNAGSVFQETLAAVRAQCTDRKIELLICDSGSSDETVTTAFSYDAEVVQIPPESFSHGGTRNLLMSRARGDHVAFLTQDSVPADEHWLARLLGAFSLADDVGLAFGPYRPGPQASPSVARELTSWFQSFSPDGPRVDRLDPAQRDGPARQFLGHLGFFTDSNGCVARGAWERVPFRQIAYAEDHLLAQDMLRAGFSKVFVPEAAVVHSHEYTTWQWLQRSFDEARAVEEVYGLVPGGSPAQAVRSLRGNVAADRRWLREGGADSEPLPALARSLVHHGARATGTVLGAHPALLPPRLTAKLSLEGRR